MKTCQTEPETTLSPTGDAETWRGQGQFVSDCADTLARMFAIYGADGRFIAAFPDKSERDQVVSDHALVPELEAALTRIRTWLVAPAVDLGTIIDMRTTIDAALARVEALKQ